MSGKFDALKPEEEALKLPMKILLYFYRDSFTIG